MAEPIRLDEGFRPSYRPDRATGWDTDMRRMGLVAAGLGAGVALLVGASTLLRPAHHGVPVVEADSGPVRVKPLDPGGMKFSGADIGATGGQGPQLAPAAEQPEIAALKAQLRQVKKELAKQAEATAQAEKLAQAAPSPPKVVAPAPLDRALACHRTGASFGHRSAVGGIQQQRCGAQRVGVARAAGTRPAARPQAGYLASRCRWPHHVAPAHRRFRHRRRGGEFLRQGAG